MATPSFSLGSGTYSSGQTVTIGSATSGATICYTTNGTAPAANTPGTCSAGTTLANGGTVTVSASETLEAIGTASGFLNSLVGSASYTIAPPAVSITISPASASLLTNGTQQFTATVAGSSNAAVTWSATGGTVSTSGLYTAPNTAGTYTVTVTSTANPSASASAAVTVSTPIQHTVTLTWIASTSTVSGYNIYRSTVSGGPYTQINTALDATTSYVDSTVQSGQTYYYVTTAVSTAGVESAYSNQAVAIVPLP